MTDFQNTDYQRPVQTSRVGWDLRFVSFLRHSKTLTNIHNIAETGMHLFLNWAIYVDPMQGFCRVL